MVQLAAVKVTMTVGNLMMNFSSLVMLPGPTNEKAAEFKVKNVDTKIENKIIQYLFCSK